MGTNLGERAVSAASSEVTSAAIVVSGVELVFGEGERAVRAVSAVDFRLAAGEFVSILGPSGCGKSTIVAALGGFQLPSAGEVRVDGERVRAPGPERAILFQQHTLFPWKTVLENIEFGLKMRGFVRRERKAVALEMLAHVGLTAFARCYPHQLSGGMQQRASLARVLVNRPRVLLMDEPFCSLDAQTRLQMQELLLKLWSELHMTVVFVTHDVDEALFLSDRVLVFSPRPGKVRADLAVALPRPRDRSVLTSEAFVALKRTALGSLLVDAH